MAIISLDGLNQKQPVADVQPVATPEIKQCTTPYTIVIDTREQRPLCFDNVITKESAGSRVAVSIPTKTRGLKSGDYSIEGYERTFALERKSSSDLIGTISRGRERFERELARMQDMDCSAVIVEAELADCVALCENTTRFHTEAFQNTIIAWQQRFPKTHWYFCRTRLDAVRTIWRIIERFLRDRKEVAK